MQIQQQIQMLKKLQGVLQLGIFSWVIYLCYLSIHSLVTSDFWQQLPDYTLLILPWMISLLVSISLHKSIDQVRQHYQNKFNVKKESFDEVSRIKKQHFVSSAKKPVYQCLMLSAAGIMIINLMLALIFPIHGINMVSASVFFFFLTALMLKLNIPADKTQQECIPATEDFLQAMYQYNINLFPQTAQQKQDYATAMSIIKDIANHRAHADHVTAQYFLRMINSPYDSDNMLIANSTDPDYKSKTQGQYSAQQQELDLKRFDISQ